MARAEVTKSISGYVFTWPKDGVSIKVRRIREGREGDTKGELTIFTNGVNPGQILRASLTFLTASTRNSMAKLLESRQPNVDWHSILDELCTTILDDTDSGEPAVTLEISDDMDIDSPGYLLEPLIAQDCPNILFGEPGSSKSTIAMLMATIVGLGWGNNPFGWGAPISPKKILVLDWEQSEATVKYMVHRIVKGMQLGWIDFITYKHCDRPLAQCIEQVAEEIDKHKPDLTIIDSLALAVGGDLNAPQPALEFWEAWRKLRTTSLIIAHPSKSQDENKKPSVYGSMWFHALSRNIWRVVQGKSDEPGIIKLALTHIKAPPFDRIREPIGIQLHHQPVDGVKWQTIATRIDPSIIPDAAIVSGDNSTGDAIRTYLLRNGSKSIKDIIAAFGGEPARKKVDIALRRLRDKGLVLHLPDGAWAWVAKYSGEEVPYA